MNTTAFRLLSVGALAALLAACGGGNGDTSSSAGSDAMSSPAASAAADTQSSPAAAAANDEFSKTFNTFVAAEDTKFADLKGAKKGEDTGMSMYEAKTQLPGAKLCLVETQGNVNFLACTINVFKAKGDADKAFEDAKSKATSAGAASKLQGADGPAGQYILKNDKQAVAVVEQKDKDGYTVTYMFGTPDDLSK